MMRTAGWVVLAAAISVTDAFSWSHSPRRVSFAPMTMAEPVRGGHGRLSRRALLVPLAPAAGAALGWGVAARPAAALVKGSAPPPKREKKEKRTCTTIDECEEVGRQREGAWI